MARIKCMFEQVRQSLRSANRTFPCCATGRGFFKTGNRCRGILAQILLFCGELHYSSAPPELYIPYLMKRMWFIHTYSDEATKCGCRLILPKALLAGLDSLFLKKARLPIENFARFGLNTTTCNIVLCYTQPSRSAIVDKGQSIG